jgi:hypothetical protein
MHDTLRCHIAGTACLLVVTTKLVCHNQTAHTFCQSQCLCVFRPWLFADGLPAVLRACVLACLLLACVHAVLQDMVPRMSLWTIERLRDEMMLCALRCKVGTAYAYVCDLACLRPCKGAAALSAVHVLC